MWGIVSKTGQLPGLTLLRFWKAFYVYCFHFQTRFKLTLPRGLDTVVANGPIAMPIFFMLSGFVLHYRYATKDVAFRQFFGARIARIYPAYLLCVLMCLPIAVSKAAIIDPNFLGSMAAFLLISVLLVQAWYPNLFPFSHVAGTWSVSVEMFLYSTYLLVRQVMNWSLRQRLLAIVCCSLVSGSFVPSLSLSFSDDLPFSVFYNIPFYHLAEFIIGVTISSFWLSGICRSSGWTVAIPIMFLVLVQFGSFNARYMGLNIVLLPLVAASIYGLANADRSRIAVVRVVVTNRISIFLGEISYSFFLMQIPIMLYIDAHPQLIKEIPGITAFLGLFVLNLVFATLAFLFIEKPGQRMILVSLGINAANTPIRNAAYDCTEQAK